ncbi:MAG: hypothetical protein QW778_05590 [Candidatus Micrarchaeaceae archaeon]
MRQMGMKFKEAYQHDYRRSKDAEENLKPSLDEDYIIYFMDETSQQTTANTQRLWSFRKQEVTRNTSKSRADTFCFYSLNGRSVVDFHRNSKKEDIMDFPHKKEESQRENSRDNRQFQASPLHRNTDEITGVEHIHRIFSHILQI